MAAKIPSLFPYLNSEKNKFYLRLLPATQDISVLQRLSHPFLDFSDSNPFARLVAAEVVTDDGSKVKDVCLFIQKDDYCFGADSLWPISNGRIDRLWSETFAFYSNSHANSPLITLVDQLDDGGRLVPFAPLFYCKLKRQYFQPPCPKCGMPLGQCRDDGVLVSAGLSAYSTSLRRYLYCSSCLAAGGDAKFYALRLESTDPLMVMDLDGLIRGFGELLRVRPDLSGFPCGECSNLRECYGAESLAGNGILPLSFYDFYLLMFEAPSLSAPDFLALAAGASFTELEERLARENQPGRINRLQAADRSELPGFPFIFGAAEKYFLEVLYLKLSFLSELARIVLTEAVAFGRDVGSPGIDSIWIRLDTDGRRLPYTWNFRVDIIDIVRGIPDDASPPPGHYSHSREFLGLVWFYTLLVNRQQNLPDIYVELRKILGQSDVIEDWSIRNLASEDMVRALAPQNIFWNPEGRFVHEDWASYWDASLALGFSLLTDAVQTGRSWSRETFRQELETLREGVKECLFQEEFTPARGEVRSGAETIIPVLERIRARWAETTTAEPIATEQTAAVVIPEKAEPPRFEQVGVADDVIRETIIISPAEPHARPGGVGAEAGGARESVDLVQTLPGDLPAEPATVEFELVSESLILGETFLGHDKSVPGEVAEAIPGTGAIPGETREEEFLAATVMVGPEKVRIEAEAGRARERVDLMQTLPGDLTAEPAAVDAESQAETVILGATPPGHQKSVPGEVAEAIQVAGAIPGETQEEDFLAATVMVSPGKPRIDAEAGRARESVDLMQTLPGDLSAEPAAVDAESQVETVILGATPLGHEKSVPGEVAGAIPGETREEDLLAATVMVGSEKVRDAPVAESSPAPSEADKPKKADGELSQDDLLETVMIVPAKPKPKDRKDSNG